MSLGRAVGVMTGAASSVGRVRENNQDAVGHFETPGLDDDEFAHHLFVVADGMGGHAGGEVASRLAIDVVHEAYFADPSDDRSAALGRALQAANAAVHARARAEPALANMGTTCSALVLRHEKAYVAHVGDTRIYLFRGGSTTRLTRDHSLAAAGRPEVLTRALGTSATLEVDITEPVHVAAGDAFLLCSDGLWGHVTDEELLQAVQAGIEPEATCQTLVALANDRGGPDNITAQLVQICGADAARPGLFAGLRRLLRAT